MKTYYSKKLKKRVTIPDYDDHTGELLEDRDSEYLKAAVTMTEGHMIADIIFIFCYPD